MAGPSFLDDLRAQAQRTVVNNTQNLARLVDFRKDSPLTTQQRAGRFWDIPAKIEASKQIAEEEYARAARESHAAGAGPPHNNGYDAQRHARWSQRTAQVAGSTFANVAGFAHELDNIADAAGRTAGAIGRTLGVRGDTGAPYDPRTGLVQTLREVPMDLHNNEEGRLAAQQGRAIDRSRLRSRP